MFGPTILHGALGGGQTVEVAMKLWGTAGGGNSNCSRSTTPFGFGGGGGYVNILSQGVIEKGSTLYVYVGQGGVWQRTTPTFGGGGSSGDANYAASGGGASYVSLNAPADINSLIAVAGGGGARAEYDEVNMLYYTDGGGLTGRDGGGASGAKGGSQIAGGDPGTGGFGGGGTPATAGAFLLGGTGAGCKGPGGGSGYYGGGGGYGDCGSCPGAGAAGGSSYINSAYFQTINNNDRGLMGMASAAAQADPDWNGSAASGVDGATSQPNGQVVIYVDGVKYNFSYTGAVQTLTI